MPTHTDGRDERSELMDDAGALWAPSHTPRGVSPHADRSDRQRKTDSTAPRSISAQDPVRPKRSLIQDPPEINVGHESANACPLGCFNEAPPPVMLIFGRHHKRPPHDQEQRTNHTRAVCITGGSIQSTSRIRATVLTTSNTHRALTSNTRCKT